LASVSAKPQRIISTISSDGSVNIYNLSEHAAAISAEAQVDEALQISPIARYDTKGSRLICMALVGFKGKQGQLEEADGEESSGEGEEGEESSESDSGSESDEDASDVEEAQEEWGGIGE